MLAVMKPAWWAPMTARSGIWGGEGEPLRVYGCRMSGGTWENLVGREHELGLIRHHLDGIHDGGAVRIVHGEAGIGKSSLLLAAGEMASGKGVIVLASSGVQSETRLPFAGLHQLLKPLLGGVTSLPRPQRTALLAAFGMTEPTAPDHFLIALAALSLLCERAESAPLLLLVEDAQWIDSPSCDVLAFVARRIDNDPIVMLVAIRDGFESSLLQPWLPKLAVGRLDEPSSAYLLDRRAPDLTPELRRAFLTQAAGNPLALVELPTGGDSVYLGLSPEQMPITSTLEAAFAERFGQLEGSTRLPLLVAAVNDGSHVGETLEATSLMAGRKIGPRSFAPAEQAGLIELHGMELQFSHPVVRSAIYQKAAVADRQAAHAALAKVIPDPDRQAWHRAAATFGPDERVAQDLVAAAKRSVDRGAVFTAVSALDRAASFTNQPALRAKWRLDAAELAIQIGRPNLASQLVKLDAGVDLNTVDAARSLLVRSATEPVRPGDPTRIHSLVDVAEQMIDSSETDLAVSLLATAATQSWWADPGEGARLRVVEAAGKLPVAIDDPRLLSILTFSDPGRHGARVIEAMSSASPEDYDAESARLIGVAVNVTGAKDLSYGFLSKAVSALREQGRLGLLPQVLAEQAWTAINMLDWAVAVSSAEEATRLAVETGQPLWEAAGLTSKAMLAGLRGDEETAEGLIRAAEEIVVPLGASVVISGIQLTRGQIALGAGRHQEAYEHLRRMFDPADSAYHHFIRSWALGDFAEAALHSGHRDEAIEEMNLLEPLAEMIPSAWFRNGLVLARPLLAEADEAERLFDEALLTDMSRWPLFRARLLLEYGSWLRRQRRVGESRKPLRTARDAFDALGLVAWGERARRELRAAGESSRQRLAESWSHLTPQEMQIAQMAADGLTNREIGQMLYLSHRTVGSHLYRIFPKLGITSRNQLTVALARPDGITDLVPSNAVI